MRKQTEIQKLTVEEANAIDVITTVYNLPFSVADSINEKESDYIMDWEENEQLDLHTGLSQIIEAIDSDDRELYSNSEEISQEDRAAFANLCIKQGF